MAEKRGDRSTSGSSRLVDVLTSRQDALRQHVGGARRGTVVGVHQARVATRRLREVVPVAAVHLDGVHRRRMRRTLRDMTRALGGVRECDVALGMLDELQTSAPAEVQPSMRRWIRRLRERRRGARGALLDSCSAERVATLDGWLDKLVEARRASVDEAWRERLALLLDTRAQRLRARIDEAGVLFVPEALHEVRIAAKRLRYVIELLGECRLASVARDLATLKRAQNALGRLHDLDVLLTDGPWTEVPATDAAASVRADASPNIWASTVATLDAERRQLHATYLRRRAGLVKVADDVRDRLVDRARPR